MEQFFSIVYGSIYPLIGNHGVSLILLSLAISLLLLPLRAVADQLKKIDEKETAGFAEDLRIIKKHYSGTERFYYIQTLHRQRGYHPIKSLRGLLGLLVQLPFFIGAYQFLGSHQPFSGVSFLLIDDLLRPDGIALGINLLPLLMTLVNIAAAFFVPTANRFEKYQLYGLSVFFLVLLYNSPAALLCYWTMNNIFALAGEWVKFHRAGGRLAAPKFAALKKGAITIFLHPKTNKALFGVLSLSVYLTLVYYLFAVDDTAGEAITGKMAIGMLGLGFLYFTILYFLAKSKRLKVTIILILLWLAVLLLGVDYALKTRWLASSKGLRMLLIGILLVGNLGFGWLSGYFCAMKKSVESKKKPPLSRLAFLLALGAVSCLIFLVPGILIMASSPGEFPGRFELLFWMSALALLFFGLLSAFWVLAGKRLRFCLFFLIIFSLLLACGNFFVLTGNYGIMDFFVFHDPAVLNMTYLKAFADAALFLAVFGASFYLLARKTKTITLFLISVHVVLLATTLPALKTLFFYRDENSPANTVNAGSFADLEPVYTFSRQGKNVLVIFFDRFIGGFMPDILKDIPSLRNDLDGFVWHPNTLSLGTGTVTGLPPVYGGYAFTDVQKMLAAGYDYNLAFSDLSHPFVLERMGTSTRFMIDLFLEKGWATLITDPSFHGGKFFGDLNIIESYGIKSQGAHLIRKYTNLYLKKEKIQGVEETEENELSLFKSYLLPFSVFKVSPHILREPLYNHGQWNSTSLIKHVKDYADSLSLAYAWPFISAIDESAESRNRYIFTTNKMTHDPYAALDNGRIQLDLPYTKKELFKDWQKQSEHRRLLPLEREQFKDRVTEAHFFAAKEALVRASAWFDWLKQAGVYDNTLIIIVADHGAIGVADPMFGENQVSPEGVHYSGYHPLLLVKDFNAKGKLRTDHAFMTNADVPAIALRAIDPEAGKKYGYDKSRGFRLYTTFDDKGKLVVYDNIFDPRNWVYTKQ